MTEVLLFHHAQGHRRASTSWPTRCAPPVTPCMPPTSSTGGRSTTSTTASAMRGGRLRRARRRGARRRPRRLPAELVYAGFSLGVMPAQRLAQTRPGARGAVLFGRPASRSSEFGGWPAGVPVQVHGMDADPFFADEGDIDAARALVK